LPAYNGSLPMCIRAIAHASEPINNIYVVNNIYVTRLTAQPAPKRRRVGWIGKRNPETFNPKQSHEARYRPAPKKTKAAAGSDEDGAAAHNSDDEEEAAPAKKAPAPKKTYGKAPAPVAPPSKQSLFDFDEDEAAPAAKKPAAKKAAPKAAGELLLVCVRAQRKRGGGKRRADTLM
jgi:hypothetical protein